MIKIIRETKILNIIENISQKTLIAEAVSTWSKKVPYEIETEMNDIEFMSKMKVIKEAVRDGYSSILEMPNIHIQAIMPRLDTLTLVSFSTINLVPSILLTMTLSPLFIFPLFDIAVHTSFSK